MSNPKLLAVKLCFSLGTLVIAACSTTADSTQTASSESSVVAELTTTTTIDPREAARERLSDWAWDPQRRVGDLLRESSLPPFENLSSKYLDTDEENSLVSISRMFSPYAGTKGCSDVALNLGHLLSVDQVSLPSGKWVAYSLKQERTTVFADIFVVELGSDSLQALQERYDNILRDNGHSCEREVNTFYRPDRECTMTVIPGRLDSCGIVSEKIRYSTEMKWMGTQPPDLETAINDTAESIESGAPSPVRQSVTSIIREIKFQWSELGTIPFTKESLFIFEPGHVALYVSMWANTRKGVHDDLFSGDFFDAITQDIRDDFLSRLESKSR